MTAYSDLDSAVSAFQGGAFEYLPKPFDVDHALELIHRALEEGGRVRKSSPATPASPARPCSARRPPCRTCSAPSAD
jgi:two-component system nitrogen regulation response regulator GlnG